MSSLGARPKRSCYIAVTKNSVKTLRQLRWIKEKSRGKDESITWPERQMMLATRIGQAHRVFLYTTFQRM